MPALLDLCQSNHTTRWLANEQSSSAEISIRTLLFDLIIALLMNASVVIAVLHEIHKRRRHKEDPVVLAPSVKVALTKPVALHLDLGIDGKSSSYVHLDDGHDNISL